mmetsp:Transcript_7505/g.23158  ORF Transcript_7505/g.23158 Transcript_7505/m.23158 type:complete len:263 (-) Transcript_7505:1041-1829(-)
MISWTWPTRSRYPGAPNSASSCAGALCKSASVSNNGTTRGFFCIPASLSKSSTAKTSAADLACEITYAPNDSGGACLAAYTHVATTSRSTGSSFAKRFSKVSVLSSGRPSWSSAESHAILASSASAWYEPGSNLPVAARRASTAFVCRVDSWRRSNGANWRPKQPTRRIASFSAPSATDSYPRARSDACAASNGSSSSSAAKSGGAVDPLKEGATSLTPSASESDDGDEFSRCCCCRQAASSASAHWTVARNRAASRSQSAT